jgi:hypothetical protein
MRYYKFFPHLPFYAKYGAIPESYLIALSYEEQLLWLCKFITDLDTKIDSSFAELKNYIDEALQNIEDALADKQDKLIAGENITISGNVISATYGIKYTHLIEEGKTLPYGLAIGDTLPLPPYTEANSGFIRIDNVRPHEVFMIHGKYTLYVINPDTNVILEKEENSGTPDTSSYEITQNGDMLIGWHDTDANFPLLYKSINFNYIMDEIEDLRHDIGSIEGSLLQMEIDINGLDNTKQDKLTQGANIVISDDIISAIVGTNYFTPTYVASSSTYENKNVGEILGYWEASHSTEAHAEIPNIEAGDTFVIAGSFEAYYIDSTTREVLQKISSIPQGTMEFEALQNCTLCVAFHNIQNHHQLLYKKFSEGKTYEAGDNITINDNVISAIIGENLHDSIIGTSTYDEEDVGDTLGYWTSAHTGNAHIEVPNVEEGDKFLIGGVFEAYYINSGTREIYQKQKTTSETTITFTAIQDCTLCIAFHDTETTHQTLYKYFRNINYNPSNNVIFENYNGATYINAIKGGEITAFIDNTKYYPDSYDIGDMCEPVQPSQNQASLVIDYDVHKSCEYYIKGEGTLYVCQGDIVVEKFTFSHDKLQLENINNNGAKICIGFDNINTNPPRVITSHFNNYYNIDESNAHYMPKTYAGQNIVFETDGVNPIISAYMEASKDNSVVPDYYIDKTANVGDTLDLTPIADASQQSAYIITDNPEYACKYKVFGDFIAYVIDSTTHEVLNIYEQSGTNPDGSFPFSIIYVDVTQTLVISWDLSQNPLTTTSQLLGREYFTYLQATIGTINTTLHNINTGTGV